MDFLIGILSKPTFLSVLGLGSIVLGIPLGIRIRQRGGPQAMMALFVFGFVLLFSLGFIIDRILTSYIPHETLLVYEALLFLLILLISKYSRRKFLIYAPSTDYFILIESKGNESPKRPGFNFPFNRILKIRNSIHFLELTWIRHPRIKIIPSRLWESYTVRATKINGLKCDLYVQGNPMRPMADIQSAIKKDLLEIFDLDHQE